MILGDYCSKQSRQNYANVVQIFSNGEKVVTKEKGYEHAKRASTNSDFHKSQTGAVAIYCGHVIAYGWNCNKTSPMQAKYNKFRGFDNYKYPASVHAEMMVVNKIKNLDIDFSKVEIYVYRGKVIPLISRPCSACEMAMRDLGIKVVHYTGNNSYITEEYG